MLNVHKKLITAYVKSEVFAMWMNPKNKETLQSIVSRAEEYTTRLGYPCTFEVQNNDIGFKDLINSVVFLVNDGKCKTVILIQEKTS